MAPMRLAGVPSASLPESGAVAAVAAKRTAADQFHVRWDGSQGGSRLRRLAGRLNSEAVSAAERTRRIPGER